jgi:uncharacterized sodium:solute symporter family permease YidK
MLASIYALGGAFLIGIAAGYFFTQRTVGIAGAILCVADIAAMFIASSVGATNFVWYFGVGLLVVPIYAALAYTGASIGRGIRKKYGANS